MNSSIANDAQAFGMRHNEEFIFYRSVKQEFRTNGASFLFSKFPLETSIFTARFHFIANAR